MVDTDDTHDGRRTTPCVWHKLRTGELIRRLKRVTEIIIEISPESKAITLSPMFHFCAPVPSLSTVPTASNPNISLAPGGGA